MKIALFIGVNGFGYFELESDVALLKLPRDDFYRTPFYVPYKLNNSDFAENRDLPEGTMIRVYSKV